MVSTPPTYDFAERRSEFADFQSAKKAVEADLGQLIDAAGVALHQMRAWLGQIRARAQERSVRCGVDLDIFGMSSRLCSYCPRGRKQSVVSRQGIVPAVAVFRIQPKVDIKLPSQFWSYIASARPAVSPIHHVLVVT